MLLMKLWSWQKENLPSIGHSVRTALAATVSVIVARLVQMPEAYWAAIATLVVMQSSLGATLTLSVERIVATAVGASLGALELNYFGANLAAFMLGIFFVGLLSFGFRLERTAYRYASVTLTIIVLIPRTNPAWIVALHRFIEVSVGIIVAPTRGRDMAGTVADCRKKCGSISRSCGALSQRLETRVVTQGIKHWIEFE
jgi:uncharacterized membrane protein YgaE (UPF0421/DUF939 family)